MAFALTKDLWLDLSATECPLVRSLSDPSPLDHIELVAGDKPIFQLHFIERVGNTMQLVELADGATLILTATKDGTTLLVQAEDFTEEDSIYSGPVDCDTDAVAAVIAAMESYQEHVAARMEVEIESDDHRVSLQFPVRFKPQVYTGQDAPTTLPGPDAYVAARAICYDREQSLTPEQIAQALANLGITITDDEIRVTCPDTTVRRALLSDL